MCIICVFLICTAIGALTGSVVFAAGDPSSCCYSKWICEEGRKGHNLIISPTSCEGPLNCSKYNLYAAKCATQLSRVLMSAGGGAAVGAGCIVALFWSGIKNNL